MTRRDKRIAETSAEFEEARSRASAAQVVNERADGGALFVVDRTGSKSARRRIHKEQEAVVANVPASKTEKALLKKKMAVKVKNVNTSSSSSSAGLKDLWGDEVGEGSSTRATTRIKRPTSASLPAAKKVAGPGFSYNPLPHAHQDVLAEALALEIKKREKEIRETRTVQVFKGESSVQPALSDGSDNDDDDDDNEDDDGDDGKVSRGSKKGSMKKTKAQRNRERRRKDLEAEKSLELAGKNALKTIDQLPKIVKSIEKEEQKAAALRELRKVQSQSAVDVTAMSYHEAGEVPLSDELSGSLRRIIPKGSGLNNTVSKLKSTGAIQFRDKFNRRKGDNTLRQQKRVVWVARHKYT